MKPALLLDVDGVLCPFEEAEGYTPHFFADQGWVWFGKENPERLARLQRRMDLVWATAWEHHANELLLEPHGLEDPLPLIKFSSVEGVPENEVRATIRGPYVYGQGTWKMPWIKAWARENPVPFVWIDDDIREDAQEWAAFNNQETPTLFIETDPVIGFTDEHEQEISDWLDNL